MSDGVVNLILVIVLSWGGPQGWYPPGEAPETPVERSERRRMIVDVVATVAQDSDNGTGFKELDAALLVLTVWRFESALEYYVHAGGDSPLGNQDGGKARCLGQLHTWPGNPYVPTIAAHRALAGLGRGATERCARATLLYLWAHAKECLRTEEPLLGRWDERLSEEEASIVMASYGSGRCSAETKSSRKRAKSFQRFRGRL